MLVKLMKLGRDIYVYDICILLNVLKYIVKCVKELEVSIISVYYKCFIGIVYDCIV